MKLASGLCSVGSADSQRDRDKSPEPCGENKEQQSLLDIFVFFLVEFLFQRHFIPAALLYNSPEACLPFLTHIDTNGGKQIDFLE